MYSCKKSSTSTNNDTLTKQGIVLEGLQEVPPVTPSGSGTINVTYTKSSKMLMFTANWSAMSDSVIAMHFHGPADKGVAAAVIVPVTDFPKGKAGTVSGMVTLNGTTQKEEDLLAGKWYYNIHTKTHTGGEIRGQIVF